MAKGAISKRKAPSKHSREARRATSPGIDTDKSLKDVRPPPESLNHRPSILAIHQGAGVSKKQTRGRNLSSKAKKRAEKNQDRAIAIVERTENKIAKSKGNSRSVQARQKNWEDINKVATLERTAAESDDNSNEAEANMADASGQAPKLDRKTGGADWRKETDTTNSGQPLPDDDDDDIL